jgi:c-di-GMP-binding flagellar brake protein YcgR
MTQPGVKTKPFHGLRLNMDLGCSLGIRIEHLDQAFRATLVGLEPQQYLLVKTAIPREFESGILPGISFHVTYQCLDEEYGFESRILDIIEKPYRLTFLSYPDNVKSLENRTYSRVCCYIPASAQLNENFIKGTITDISTSGCRFVIRLPDNLMPRQVLLIESMILSFPVMGMQGIQTFSGVVKNTTIDREKIALGIEFLNLSSTLYDSIDDYIRNVTEISISK